MNRWFDTNAFQGQAPFQYGDAGHNILVADSLLNLDLELAKRRNWGKNQSLQFRTEFFNARNHPTLGTPVGAVDSDAFGRVTSASTGRQIQVDLKYSF